MHNEIKKRCVNCLFNVDNETKTCPKCGSDKMEIIGAGNEKLNLTENKTVVLSLNFELYEPIFIGGKIRDKSDSTLIMEKDGETLKGFRIIVKDPDDESVGQAKIMASRFVNYLSFKTGLVVRHKEPRISRVEGNVTTHVIFISVSGLIAKPFDIDIERLQNTLDNGVNPVLNKRLCDAYEGKRRFQDNDFSGAITSFHKVIESSEIKAQNGEDAEDYYKPLRNLVDHHELKYPGNKEPLEKCFGIKIQLGIPADFNDPEIQSRLEKYAIELNGLVTKYLDSELKKLSL